MAEAFHRLLLGEAHAGQFRLGEHGAGHQAVIHLPRPAAEHAVGEGAALIHRHRGEVDLVGHVAHGVDAGHVGALVGIHRDAMALDGYAGRLQVRPLEERPPPGGQQHAAAGDGFAALGGHGEFARRALAGDRGGRVGEADLDAGRFHALLHRLAGLQVEAAQQVVAPHQLGHLHAQAVEDAGELAGDEARTHHHHRLRQRLQQEHVVAHPAQIGAGDVGAMGPTAHGDQDVLTAELAGAAIRGGHLHAVGAAEPSPAAHQFHAGLLQKADVEGVEPVHLGAHVGQQGGGIEAHVAHGPAVAGGIGEQVVVSRAVHQEFLGDAAADHAGAPHLVALHDRHPGAVARCALGGG